jgi:hypothetical protein
MARTALKRLQPSLSAGKRKNGRNRGYRISTGWQENLALETGRRSRARQQSVMPRMVRQDVSGVVAAFENGAAAILIQVHAIHIRARGVPLQESPASSRRPS